MYWTTFGNIAVDYYTYSAPELVSDSSFYPSPEQHPPKLAPDHEFILQLRLSASDTVNPPFTEEHQRNQFQS